MKIFKNKKADESGGEFIVYIIHAFVFAFVFIAFLFIIGSYSSEKTRIPDGVEQEIIAKRFLDTCFSYEGNIGIIDFDQFNDNRLNYCYTGVSQSYKLTLTNKDINIKPKNITTTNWEGYANKFFTEKVLVYKDDNLYEGELKIEIQS